MPDRIETIYNSTIQHGPLNRRIYLMQLEKKDIPQIIPAMDRLARNKAYEKIFAKVPRDNATAFFDEGYREEAAVPGYFNGHADTLFLCRYYSEHRSIEKHPRRVQKNWEAIRSKRKCKEYPENVPHFPVELCRPDDIPEMSRLYSGVFQSYPFPIFDQKYIAETMNTNVRYYCIRKKGRIVALASSEMDEEHRNVELTDFAVLHAWRRKNLALALLSEMENQMRETGMLTAYTIARTLSPGMNMTFVKAGYSFGGKLTNNTHIAGGIESMWVWHKNF